MTTFLPSDSVADVLDKIRSLGNPRIIDVCVVDSEGKLVGVCPLQNVAVFQPSQQLSELIFKEPLAVNMMEPSEDVVKLLDGMLPPT